jgi:ABC-type phosphate transport system substrate-binding protein
MKSIFFRFCSTVVLAFLICQGANAGDIVVISNSEITISTDEVEDIYTGEKQFAGSTRLIPVDNAALQESFLAKLMQTDTNKYNRIWTKKLFRDGLAQPAMKSGDAEVIAYVKRTLGAIGYVSSTPSGVKIIRKLSAQ